MIAFQVLVTCAFIAALAASTPTTPVAPNLATLPVATLIQGRDGLEVTWQSTTAQALAKAQYNGSYASLGWDYLHVKAADSVDGYYYGGYTEGYLTAAALNFTNFGSFACPTAACNAWIDAHIAFMLNSSAVLGPTDLFWDRVGKILAQMRGIADGYNNATNATTAFREIFLDNFGNELGDVLTAIGLSNGHHHHRLQRIANNQHCSALIKVTHDDIFVSHDTWSGFNALGIRIFKVYEFGSAKVSLDGWPGQVASGTDWYVTSHELAVQETTNIVWNTSLYAAVVPETVSEFIRVMVANYLAASGPEWAAYFSRLNSGTYNNQWMVVDYKLFEPGQPLRDDLLWVAEQIPGWVMSADVTDVLRRDGYWASYNINYFRDLYVISGYEAVEREQGTFWSYTKYARPEIFRRNQTAITAMPDMQRMMRYNDYARDPFSLIPNCTGADSACKSLHSSMLTIASRGDLMPVYPTAAQNAEVYGPLYSWVAQGCFGAIDSKISSYKTHQRLSGLAVNGPTNDQQPTFTWGENPNCPSSGRPAGSAATYDFPWVSFNPVDI